MLMLNTVYRKDSIYYEDATVVNRELDIKQLKQSKQIKVRKQSKEGKEILELKLIKEGKQQTPFFSFKKPQKKTYTDTNEERL